MGKIINCRPRFCDDYAPLGVAEAVGGIYMRLPTRAHDGLLEIREEDAKALRDALIEIYPPVAKPTFVRSVCDVYKQNVSAHPHIEQEYYCSARTVSAADAIAAALNAQESA